MGNELTYDFGLPVTLVFGKANPVANTTTALTLANGGLGLKVPAGYKFHPMLLHGESNADLTAGVATFKVTANTTVLSEGPVAVLGDTVQVHSGVQRPNAEPISAGAIVGVSVILDANVAPNTADVDAILVGVLMPG